MTYYVCENCNLYHTGRKPPRRCERCGCESLEKIQVNDPDFDFIMKIAKSIGKKKQS